MVSDGFDFLGVTIKDSLVSVSEAKQQEIKERIMCLDFNEDGFSSKSIKTWEGITQYYAKLLPQTNLELFDEALVKRITTIIKDNMDLFSSKSKLKFALKTFNFLSLSYSEVKDEIVNDFLSLYTSVKSEDKQEQNKTLNKKIINERKREFRKIEAETSGLLVTKPGTFIGLTTRGISIKDKGKLINYHRAENLSNIIIVGNGISLSSNLIAHCMSKKIPIDFFDLQGTHIGSLLSTKLMETSLWAEQAFMKVEKKMVVI